MFEAQTASEELCRCVCVRACGCACACMCVFACECVARRTVTMHAAIEKLHNALIRSYFHSTTRRRKDGQFAIDRTFVECQYSGDRVDKSYFEIRLNKHLVSFPCCCVACKTKLHPLFVVIG